MSAPDTTRAFAQRVYTAVNSIPQGRVASYGQLALLCGRPQGARLVGRAMAFAPPGTPCHRVVNAAGRTAPGWEGQRAMLEAEGVAFRPNGCVDMKLCRWRPYE